MKPASPIRLVPVWFTSIAWIIVASFALAVPAQAENGGGNQSGGVAAPDTGTLPDARQPDPTPSPGPPPPNGYQPAPAVEYWSPVSFYSSVRVQLGTEVFEDQPGLDGPGVFAVGLGFDLGVSINFTPWARLTLMPFSVDFINSNFSYDDPDSGNHEIDGIFGSRVTFGVLLDIGPVHFGVRYGERSYWTNKKVGAANISLIGNDYTRNVVDLSVAYIGDIVVGYIHIGATVEFPLDSQASKYALFLDIAARFYFP